MGGGRQGEVKKRANGRRNVSTERERLYGSRTRGKENRSANASEREETMNEGVICNGISWQQWRIVCRDVRIVPVDGHYRRTLRFRRAGTVLVPSEDVSADVIRGGMYATRASLAGRKPSIQIRGRLSNYRCGPRIETRPQSPTVNAASRNRIFLGRH